MQQTLKPTLNAWHLWGLAVGLVISGEYFGWSYGWASAGTLGFLVTSLMVAVMYTTFIFSFTELTTAIPHAGGPFAYASRALGPTGGFIAGFATLVEFVFAPPAIALAIGAYLNVQFPGVDPKLMAVGAYVVFMTLNIVGVKTAVTFELLITLLAIAELLVFMGVVAPAFSFANFAAKGWAGSDTFSVGAISGMFAAIPFPISSADNIDFGMPCGPCCALLALMNERTTNRESTEPAGPKQGSIGPHEDARHVIRTGNFEVAVPSPSLHRHPDQIEQQRPFRRRGSTNILAFATTEDRCSSNVHCIDVSNTHSSIRIDGFGLQGRPGKLLPTQVADELGRSWIAHCPFDVPLSRCAINAPGQDAVLIGRKDCAIDVDQEK